MRKLIYGPLVALGFCLVAVQVKAVGSFDNQHPFPMLSQKQFKTLSKTDQMSYLKDIQNMLIEVDKIVASEAKKPSRRLEGWLQLILSTAPEAQAATADTCTLSKPRGAYCMYCPTFGVPQGYGAQTPNTICGESVDLLYKKLQTPQDGYPKVTIDLELLRKYEKEDTFSEGLKVPVELTKKDGSTEKSITPSGPRAMDIPETRFQEPLNNAMPATKRELVKNGTVVEVEANTAGRQIPGSADVYTPASDTSEAYAAELHETFKNGLRCIYAGFPITGSKCEGISEFKNGDGINSGDGKTYSCLPAGQDTGVEKNKVHASKPNAKKTVLCNPFLFGLDKDSKPLCIAKSKTATKDCATLANAEPGSVQRALTFNDQNRDEFKKITWALGKLCKKKHGEEEEAEYEKDLEEFMESSGSGKPQKSVEDIKATCIEYSARFSTYFNELYNPPEGSRGRN